MQFRIPTADRLRIREEAGVARPPPPPPQQSSCRLKTCAICLGDVKCGKGRAIFTAECSHSFHFSCIANSVEHGHYHCPICRSKWKDLPLLFPCDPQPNVISNEDYSIHSPPATFLHQHEPIHFSDDESLPVITRDTTSLSRQTEEANTVILKALPEFPSVVSSEYVSKFPVLVGVKAPPLLDDARDLERAPVDLVTVLDVSSSMEGSKLMLLKHAVRFVIQNLGPSDRLAIVAFSSDARRIFPLHIMSESGQEDAILAVNSLLAEGGTNITEGLKKGARILQERRERNPVASIILLSYGKDTVNDLHFLRRNSHNPNSTNSMHFLECLNQLRVPVPNSNRLAGAQVPFNIPVHTFGFGTDHDLASMHLISDSSGGTFSFIESIAIVQDAFARCIGGLLSVVAQDLCLTVSSASSGVNIISIPSGRYLNDISEQGKEGVIHVGDLYADEKKEFLVYVTVPIFLSARNEETVAKTLLLDVKCSFKEIVSMETVQVEAKRVEIWRPNVLSLVDLNVSLEVDSQRNRLLVAETIEEAQHMADQGDLEGAQAALNNQK